MVAFHEKFPDRYFDVGIAEQHAVTLAAGMACEGAHPVVAIYSTFLQRAYDQVIHDVALQDLPVLFAIDRAGLVGPDGPTHAGSFDLSFLRCIPNMVIMAPADENECRRMLYTGFCHQGPAAVRYPRGTGPGVEIEQEMSSIPLGQSRKLKSGRKLAILAFGSLVEPCRQIAEDLDATLIDMRFIKPLDKLAVSSAVDQHDYLVTVEENAVAGGAGSGVNELIASTGKAIPTLNIGLADNYIQHGTREECLQQAGLDTEGIRKQIRAFLDVESRIRRPLSSLQQGVS
jgi:1-deoxy-D-xylulose-5-phosphate synthase